MPPAASRNDAADGTFCRRSEPFSWRDARFTPDYSNAAHWLPMCYTRDFTQGMGYVADRAVAYCFCFVKFYLAKLQKSPEISGMGEAVFHYRLFLFTPLFVA